jgi:hypothetical protein
MRPRYSIRWLLIAFGILTVVFYLLFVRPTVLAEKLITSTKDGVHAPLPPSLTRNDDMLQNRKWKFKDARLQPREWADVWRFRRRFTLILSREPPFINTVLLDITAGPIGYYLNRTVHGQSTF